MNLKDKDTYSSFGVGIKSLLAEQKLAEHSLRPPTPLYPVSEVDAGLCGAEELEPMRQTVSWMRSFLAKPHANLGRTGPVCPFVPMSLALDTIYMTVIPHDASTQPETIEETVGNFRDIFLELEPKDGDDAINKSLMMLFPNVPHEQGPILIDAVQQKLKPRFTRFGLMLGEFHQLNETPGLRNADFRPLRSPICMLVIRYMVESDLPFLERPNDPPGARIGFLRSYLRRLGGRVSERKLDMAINALVDAEIEKRTYLKAEADAAAAAEAARLASAAEAARLTTDTEAARRLEAAEAVEVAMAGASALPVAAPVAAGKCPFGHN